MLFREDKKVAYRAVLVLLMTLYSVLSHKLIFDDLFRTYLHCLHSAPSAFLTFSPCLFKSRSSFEASSVASHHASPSPTLRIPT